MLDDAFRLEGPPLRPHHQGGRHGHRQVGAEGTGLNGADFPLENGRRYIGYLNGLD